MPPTDSEDDDDEFRVHSLNVKQTHSYLEVYTSDEDENANYCEDDEDEIIDGGEEVTEEAAEEVAEEADEGDSESTDKSTVSFVCWRKAFLPMKRWNNGQESSASPYGHSSHGLQRSSSAFVPWFCITT